jgi:DNA-dependent protein kinase catalytic subunit
VDLSLLRGYKTLAANGLLAKNITDSVDAVALLKETVSMLPINAAVVRLPQEQADQLVVLVDLLATLVSDADLQAFVLDITMSPKWAARQEWFLRQCGACFVKPLLATANTALTSALDADFSRLLRLLSIMVGLAARGPSGSTGPLVSFVESHWDRISGSLDSRTDILRTVFVVQTLAGVVRPDQARHIGNWFCRLLGHPTADYKAKVKALRLLGFVASGAASGAGEDEKLRSALQAFGALHLPVLSRELPEDSLEQNLYKNLFRQIMAVFQQCRAASLLYFLISVAAREADHVLESELQVTLARAMSSATSTADQLALLSVPWEIFADISGTFKYSVRLACLSRFLIPMTTTAAPSTITRFFTQHMEALLATITAEVRGTTESRSTALTGKIGAMQMFEMLYARLDQAHLHTPGAPLVGLAANILRQKDLFKGKGDGKDLTLFLLKVLDEARAENAPESGGEALRELYRSLHCSNLNAVVSIISCTQTTEKVFHAFIFKEKRDQNKLIWSKIVDTDKVLEFPLLVGRDIGHRKHWVSARHQEGAGVLGPDSSLASQRHYLADSSLSQDLSRYDFTTTSITGHTQTPPEKNNGETLSGAAAGGYIELEDDDLGRHPCMAPLVAVSRLMADEAMYPVPQDDFSQAELPGYMRTVQSLLTDQPATTGRNVKLFFLKFIYNCSEVFQPFAVHFYRPVLECVSDGTLSPEGGLNYLLTDLLIMLLDWSEKTATRPDPAKSGDRVAVARSFSLLMKNIWHTDTRIFKMNLELVRMMLALWKAGGAYGGPRMIITPPPPPRAPGSKIIFLI